MPDHRPCLLILSLCATKATKQLINDASLTLPGKAFYLVWQVGKSRFLELQHEISFQKVVIEK